MKDIWKGEMMLQVNKTTKCFRRCKDVNLLGGNLDELLEKLHPLAELRTQTNLCDHPKLNFIEPPQEQIQVHGGFPDIFPPKCVVDEFKLLDTKENQIYIWIKNMD